MKSCQSGPVEIELGGKAGGDSRTVNQQDTPHRKAWHLQHIMQSMISNSKWSKGQNMHSKGCRQKILFQDHISIKSFPDRYHVWQGKQAQQAQQAQRAWQAQQAGQAGHGYLEGRSHRGLGPVMKMPAQAGPFSPRLSNLCTAAALVSRASQEGTVF